MIFLVSDGAGQKLNSWWVTTQKIIIKMSWDNQEFISVVNPFGFTATQSTSYDRLHSPARPGQDDGQAVPPTGDGDGHGRHGPQK